MIWANAADGKQPVSALMSVFLFFPFCQIKIDAQCKITSNANINITETLTGHLVYFHHARFIHKDDQIRMDTAKVWILDDF